MKLRQNERYPIHNSFFCCGRQQAWKKRNRWAAVERIEDPYHPRGYRERRSPVEMKKLREHKIVEQDMSVESAMSPLQTMRKLFRTNAVKGNGAGRRDDHPDNIQAAHRICNLKKGSRSVH